MKMVPNKKDTGFEMIFSDSYRFELIILSIKIYRSRFTSAAGIRWKIDDRIDKS